MSLPAGIRAGYIHCTKRMVSHGPNLGMPHSRAMGDGLFELRMKSSEGIGRVFYCTVVEQTIAMLHTFLKKNSENTGQ